jgi:predicted nucleic acid-binding protein
MTLLDTSVWIQVFRQHNPVDIESVVPFEEVVVCLPVIQEILQGVRDEQAFRVARDSLLAIPCVESPLDQDMFIEAADLYRRARRAGFTVRSGVDCLIAACAIRNDLMVIHQDRDYSALARVSPLRQRSLAGQRRPRQ